MQAPFSCRKLLESEGGRQKARTKRTSEHLVNSENVKWLGKDGLDCAANGEVLLKKKNFELSKFAAFAAHATSGHELNLAAGIVE